MFFLCNSCNKTSTFDEVNSATGQFGSGSVDIDSLINSGEVGEYEFCCPKCKKSTLLHDESYPSEPKNNTFSIVESESNGGASGGGGDVSPDEPEVEIPVEKVSPVEWNGYVYKQHNFASNRETEEQKGKYFWEEVGNDGITDIYFGTKKLNSMEEGIAKANMNYQARQTLNMAHAMQQLRTGKSVDVAFHGDSIFWAFDNYSENKVPTSITSDNGHEFPLSYGYCTNPIKIPDCFEEKINEVFENKITITRKIWTGDTVGKAFQHWNATKSNFCIFNYGINDAMGSHVPISIKGKIDVFLEGYRRLIEREIENGTAVILLTPFKQMMLENDLDTTTRAMIDVFERAVYYLGREFNCPVVDGNLMVKNFGSDSSIDFTHFIPEGNQAIGYRLVSLFVGQSINEPKVVGDGSYLGVNYQLDNANIVAPAILSSSDSSPNIPAMMRSEDLVAIERVSGGLQVALDKNGGKVVWSFYADRDGLVVVPNLACTSTSANISVKLDFGAMQGKWSNYFNYVGTGEINRDYAESSSISSQGNVANWGKHNLENTPVIKITTEGWHTIEISVTDLADSETLDVYGLNFLSLDMYNLLLK